MTIKFICRFDTDDLEILSCTDLKCTWKEPQKKTLVHYSGTSIEHHECYVNQYKNCGDNFSKEQISSILKELFGSGNNALTRHK